MSYRNPSNNRDKSSQRPPANPNKTPQQNPAEKIRTALEKLKKDLEPTAQKFEQHADKAIDNIERGIFQAVDIFDEVLVRAKKQLAPRPPAHSALPPPLRPIAPGHTGTNNSGANNNGTKNDPHASSAQNNIGQPIAENTIISDQYSEELWLLLLSKPTDLAQALKAKNLTLSKDWLLAASLSPASVTFIRKPISPLLHSSIAPQLPQIQAVLAAQNERFELLELRSLPLRQGNFLADLLAVDSAQTPTQIAEQLNGNLIAEDFLTPVTSATGNKTALMLLAERGRVAEALKPSLWVGRVGEMHKLWAQIEKRYQSQVEWPCLLAEANHLSLRHFSRKPPQNPAP